MTFTSSKLFMAAFTALWATLLTLLFPALPTAGTTPPSTVYVPVSLPETTTTTTTAVTTCEQVYELAVKAGWIAKLAVTATNIAARESHCTETAFNPTDPNGGSYGLYQINGYWCKPNTQWVEGWLQQHGIVNSCYDLFNPQTNTEAAYAIWQNSGWSPWGM